MPTPSSSCLRWTLALVVALLAACRKEVPAPPVPPAEPTPRVSSSAELPAASDRSNAPPAIGAMTAGQAAGGKSDRAMQPSGGDGRPAASAPAPRASPP